VAEYTQLEQSILKDLAAIGVRVESIGRPNSLTEFMPLDDGVVQVLLRHLPTAHPRLQVTIASLLLSAKNEFSGEPLARAFEATESNEVRWQIADTIARTRPTGLTQWVVDAFTNPKFGRSREMLAVAVARLAPKEQANSALKRMFVEFPLHVPLGLAETGEYGELEFLKSHLREASGASEKEIRKAIRSIEKRLGEHNTRGI
jgi:hypothetical protein